MRYNMIAGGFSSQWKYTESAIMFQQPFIQEDIVEFSLWIGTYTHGNSQGIYRALWWGGTLHTGGFTAMENPSYLAVHENRLYAVRETDEGSVVSYHVDANGGLVVTGEQPVLGDAPCHLCVVGNQLYVSNYQSGGLAIFELDGQGAVTSPPRVIAHEGGGANERQRSPHVHQAQPTPDGRFLAVCDLGTDAIYFYPLHADGIHMPAQRVPTAAGAGPRHAVFGANETWYVLCELSCELLVYRGYGSDAKLIGKMTTLRAGDTESACAALRLSPDGTLLLATVRGANTLVLWDVSPEGELSGQKWFDAHGDWPRDAAFTPSGRHVLCACELDNQVTSFAVSDGRLLFLQATALPSPTCICFM